jgi:hypothetical protein
MHDRMHTITRALAAITLTTAAAVSAGALPAAAAEAVTTAAKVASLNQVMTNIELWVGGLLAGLATLLATVGGLRYLLGAGDPGETMKAKETLKYAAIGYGIAVLAPLLVTILKGFVGG